MKRLLLVLALMFSTSLFAIQPVNAGELCADGSWSNSSGKGTCSWHGGIAGGSGSKMNTYKVPAPVYKAPVPVYKAPTPVYKSPSIGNSGITGFCSAMDRNKGRCR
jgi:hypothetical protein